LLGKKSKARKGKVHPCRHYYCLCWESKVKELYGACVAEQGEEISKAEKLLLIRKVAETLLEEETDEVLMEIEEATSPDNDEDGSGNDEAQDGEEGVARDQMLCRGTNRTLLKCQ